VADFLCSSSFGSSIACAGFIKADPRKTPDKGNTAKAFKALDKKFLDNTGSASFRM
jgi:hypothetical protein